MSTNVVATPIIPEPIQTTVPANKPKKRSKKKKKKKKSFPLNPIQLDLTSISDNHPQHRSRKSITDLSEIQHPKSARKPSKSPPRRRKKKSINKASALIRVSPRFSSKTQLIPRAITPCQPLKRRKKKRTNSSTVYKFVEYNVSSEENESELSCHSLSTTPIAPLENNVSLSSLSKKKVWGRPRSRRARARMRASSVGYDCSDSDSNNNNNNNALLKRLKTENKELRKSRNMLRKNNGLLLKIERKLRHKLDIILSKFRQIRIDLVGDDTDWIKLQKGGDIIGILDAVFAKFSKITDKFLESEKRINKLGSEWNSFALQRLFDDKHSIDDMFCILSSSWDSIQNENVNYCRELNGYREEHCIISGELDKKTADMKLLGTYIREMELENSSLKCDLERIVSENKTLNERKEELMGLKMEHLAVTSKLNEVQSQIDGLQEEFGIIYKKKKKFETENSKLRGQIAALRNIGECDGNNDDLLELESENMYLMKELKFLIGERSRFKECASEKDYHRGDIKCIVVSPINYRVITGGKEDNSLRIWEPKSRKTLDESEITFVPKEVALIDGQVLTVSISDNGSLMAAGASLNNSVNGYIVVWMMDNGNVLCNLRSRSRYRFAKIYCISFMKIDNNDLLFGGDKTGCILCWKLSNSSLINNPIAVINGHSDIIYDLSIVNHKWLFSVSNDECLMHLNLDKCLDLDHNQTQYLFSKRLWSDKEKYPLKCIIYNENANELIFGSRQCNIFKLNNDDDDDDDLFFLSKYALNSKDNDHILHLKIRDNLMIIQRSATNYVKIFNLTKNKLVKTYQIDDAKDNNHNKFKIYDCGISFDKKYAILCVGIFNKENINNLQLNRSALKGFKIPNWGK